MTSPGGPKSVHARAAGRDPYWPVLREQWPHIALLYGQYADKNPVMLFDIQERRVYAFLFREFHAELSEQSQASLADQYERALADGRIVVFIRDNEREQLVSYSLPLQNEARFPDPAGRRRDQRK
jgi:hypothetical protein